MQLVGEWPPQQEVPEAVVTLVGYLGQYPCRINSEIA